MKKAMLLVCHMFILILAYGQTKSEALDGIDSITANARVNHFNIYKGIDVNPAPTNIWLSKKVIHNIVTLLTAESAAETPQQGTGPNAGDNIMGMTDGVRFYFASDPQFNDNKLHTSIIMVSTKDAGIDNALPVQSGKLHLDYWQHSNKVDLSVTNLDEIVYNDGNNTVGDSLYFSCGCPEGLKCSTLPNNITRGLGEQMVDDFKGHVVNSVSEWFPLKLFIALDAVARPDGIRLYFATHPHNDKRYPDRDAIVIVTTELKNGQHTDYFDCAPAHQKEPPQDNGELCPSHCQ